MSIAHRIYSGAREVDYYVECAVSLLLLFTQHSPSAAAKARVVVWILMI
jgi:hypothetical protein